MRWANHTDNTPTWRPAGYNYANAQAFINGVEGAVGGMLGWADSRLARAQATASTFVRMANFGASQWVGPGSTRNVLQFNNDALGAFVDGLLGVPRLATNPQMGVAAIGAIENPRQTLGAMRQAFHEASWRDIGVEATAGLIGVVTGTGLSRLGALAEVAGDAGAALSRLGRYRVEFESVRMPGTPITQMGAVNVRLVSPERLAQQLTELGGNVKYLEAAQQARIPRSSWTAAIRGHLGMAPDGMLSPHRHHILELNGHPGVHRALIREGQDILRSYGIDPVRGTENLIWAPNRGHGVAPTRLLVEELRFAAEAGLPRDYVIETLLRHGGYAQTR
jgi:hypothetical protein